MQKFSKILKAFQFDTLYQPKYVIFLLLGIALPMGVLSSLQNNQLDWRGLGGNLATEFTGAAITFFVFDKVIERRDNQRFKQKLIEKFGSNVNAKARRAAEELRTSGWLTDGSLRHISLSGANLNHANLREADLSHIPMFGVELQEADLEGCLLQGIEIIGGNLREAKLGNANLQDSKLLFTDLRGAQLGGADLRGVNLTETLLERAVFEVYHSNPATNWKWECVLAVFDETTILPDGTFWTKEEDMTRFTHPDHPNFWRSKFPLIR